MTKETPKKTRKATKDLKLLSFADEETDPIVSTRIHPVHDSKLAKDAKLKAEVAPELLELLHSEDRPGDDRGDDEWEGLKKNFEEKLRSRVLEKQSKSRRKQVPRVNPTHDPEESPEEVVEQIETPATRETELQRLREGIIKSRRAVKILLGQTAEKLEKDNAFHNMSTAVEAMRQKYKKRKLELGDRQNETLSRLEAFTSGLRQQKKTAKPNAEPAVVAPVYHGQVLEEESEDDKEPLEGWFQGKLKFKKHIDDGLRLGGDGRKLDDIVVIDSRKNYS